MNQYIAQITRIIYTLNQVTVRGKENLDCLLASIQSLEQMKEEMQLKMLEGNVNAAKDK